MATTGKQLASRMVRASLADTELYAELARDAGAIRQSFLAVLIVAATWGMGSAVGYLLDGDTGGAVVGFLVTGLWAVLFWLLFSGIAYVITRTMAGYFEIDVAKITYLQFVRSIGFVFTPGILIILTPIPFVGQVAVLMALHVDGARSGDCDPAHHGRAYRAGRHGRVRRNPGWACDLRAHPGLPAAVAGRPALAQLQRSAGGPAFVGPHASLRR